MGLYILCHRAGASASWPSARLSEEPLKEGSFYLAKLRSDSPISGVVVMHEFVLESLIKILWSGCWRYWWCDERFPPLRHGQGSRNLHFFAVGFLFEQCIPLLDFVLFQDSTREFGWLVGRHQDAKKEKQKQNKDRSRRKEEREERRERKRVPRTTNALRCS